MRVAITGATGNVGTRLVERLLAEPSVTEVVGIASRLPTGPARHRVRYVRVDLGEPDAATKLTGSLAGVDAVVHLAWLLQPSREPEVMERVNIGGTRAVLAAVVSAGVGALVHASSIGAYSPAPKTPAVKEDAPTLGIATSSYSRQKAQAERMIEAFTAEHPDLRVVQIRPALVLARSASTEQARYFLGRLVPHRLVNRRLLGAVGVLPLPDAFTTQVVHTADIADLFARAVVDPRARGVYNGAAEPVLDPPTIAAALGVRLVRVPLSPVRVLADLTWQARLQPTDPGWVDIASQTPLIDSSRARDELGWRPTHDARATLLEALDGVADGSGSGTPPLRGRQTDPAAVLKTVRSVIGAFTRR